MSLSSLYRFAIAQTKYKYQYRYQQQPRFRWFSQSILFWLLFSVLFSVYYGGSCLIQAFSSEYVAQDDAREYIFWMQRFIDGELFRNDLTADYFQSITPIGYARLYQLMAGIGIPPLFFSKILPPCLGIIGTIYTYFLSLRLFPVAITAFISTLIFNQSIWFADDIASATPRSFIYIFLPAFLYYLFQESRLAVGIIVVLQALFYPLLVFLYSGILIIHWRKQFWQLIIVLGLAFAAMLPYLISASKYAPIVTYQQAWQMGEHWVGGRHTFFVPNPWQFWLFGQHSGIVPGVMPPLIWASLLFPWLRTKLRKFPLLRLIKQQDIKVIMQAITVAVALYFAAHLFFLKLFFPTRHTVHLFRVIMSLFAGITLTAIWDWLIYAYNRIPQINWRKLSFGFIAIFFAIILIFYPSFLKSYPESEYRIGNHPGLYRFLQQQPKDTLIASISDEADNLPTFSQRPILTSREYALPFHLGYYRQIRQRLLDLIAAQYSPSLQPAQALIQKYGIDFWLIEKNSWEPDYLREKTWLNSFQPAFNRATDNLQKQQTPAVQQVSEQCTVWEDFQFWLLEADCIVNQQ